MDLLACKEQFRREIKKKLSEIPENIHQDNSEKIINSISELNQFRSAVTIFAYYSFGYEVDTISLIKKTITGEQRLGLPVIKNNRMEMICVDEYKFTKDETGVPAPAGGKTLYPRGGDIILVPGVGYDIKGNRLGRGRGFYDRYLLSYCSDIYKLGIVYSCQVIDDIPCDETDAVVNAIMTEKGPVTMQISAAGRGECGGK